MKNIFYSFLALCAAANVQSQNTGIGVANPTRAKLEVWGVSGTGTTSGLFGSDRGISLQRNYAAIGLNQYVDNNNVGRFMGQGYAAVWQYIHNDVTLAQGFSLTTYPNSGIANQALPAGNRVWNFTSNNRFQILSNGAGGSAILDVGRGTGGDGTAVFIGTYFNSVFNNAANEYTYIRGGKGSSKVILNDVANGKVVFGNTAATVGLNTNYYIPPTTLEVRQSNGGIELTNSSYPDRPWEWRVAWHPDAPTFNLYYQGFLKNYFSEVNGKLANVSDERVKTNIQSLSPVMNRIMQLELVTYMMKDAVKGQRRTMGFIAQNVAPLFPTLVSHNMPGGNDLMGLDYSGFGVLAVKGIQEEQLHIEKLETDISNADKRLRAIEQKIAAARK